MRKVLFVFASTVALITSAAAQYGYQVFPRYTVPDYAPRYRWDERSPPQMPETYEKQKTPNNALSGPIGLGDPNAVGGECAKGFSEETCRRRGQNYNPR
jgi:hypothetical protein